MVAKRKRRHRILTFPDGGQPRANQRILLTGASGSLGRELAIRLAGPGASLVLWGRNAERLGQLAAQVRAAGAEAEVCLIDISDSDAALAALRTQDDHQPFGVALLVAGQGDTLAPGTLVESPEQVSRMLRTNFVAPAAMASCLAERMASRGYGRIAFVGTAAADHSLPFAASYSASKAGLARFADALRLAVGAHGVRVTLISPGFFSGDVAGVAGRPGEISAAIVAERMIEAVQAGRAELVVPRWFLLLRWLDRLLPRFVRDRLLLSLRLP